MNEACTEPLGMESGLITDAQITASSEWDANHAATQARLNFKAGGGKQGGWSTRPNDLNQWIQIDLVSYTKVTRIATQGRNAAHNQWVTKYKLQYSDDGVNFYYYMEAGQNSPKEFDANQDRDTPVYHQLSPPIQSRYIRLRPTAWHSHISIRMELYGCKIACTEPLGMESGLITDAQITASSEWDANHAATQARLNFKAGGGKQGGWSTRPNDLNQWIQIDLVSYTKVTRIATQGRNAAHNQWVTEYKLQYSDDGVNFYYYMEAGQNSPKEFDANQDRDTPVYHQLSPPIQSRYIRLRPTAWHSHISMRMELYGCKIACTEPLGMESGLITDAQITASSEWDANHAATQARLNFKAGGGKQGGWSTRPNDLNQWIQIDLVSYTKVTRIATQGRNAAHNQWVTKYKLQYSDDGVNFYYYMEAGQNSPKEFDANQDRDTPVYHQLSPPIQSRYIRLRPTAWHSHISMRMELYGCKIACTEPLGMESGLITDAQITASSEWDANHAATQARLNFKAGGGKQGGWSTRPNDLNQWIQIDLVSYTKVTRIATQGRNAAHNQWVTKYKLQYSDDGVNFYYYMEAGQNSPKEFDANQDRDTPVYHQLSPPIQSRYIRLRPTAWHSHISMRMELYGCKIACTEPLGMESGLITDAQITASSEWDANHAATQARLNFKAGGGKQGGWSTRPNDLNQWIQIDLVSYTEVTRIATQGRNAAHNQWVTKYKLQYSDDGVNFYYYMEAGQNSPKEFDANQDRDTPVYHQLSPPIQSRYIRLRPTAWHSHISMRMELYGCKIACTEPLGMESGLITDAQITASSEWDANHAATQARLNFKAGGGKQGGWSTRPNDLNQWIQIDLVSYTEVTRIATQGRNAAHNQWVTKYKLQYSDDGVNFYYYMEAGQNSPKEFESNQDRDTPVYHQLSPPIQSRYIRLRPTAWHSHISMRMELYGCKIACTEPLGMESGLITDAQITASSEWDANHAATQARLNFKAGGGKQGGWSTRPNDLNQWIQIDLVSYTKVTRIATQGRNAAHNQWVTKYKLQYSDDGVNFYYYMEAGQNSPKEFDANQDRDTPVYHQLSPPIQSRYIRLRPTAWHSHISMRMELYGCKIACTEPLGMESGLLTDAQITASSEWDANHAATQARLNFKAGGGKQGGWSTRPNDLNQWIQIDLVSYTKVTRIATQGRNAAHNQWVTKYKLQYSDDGVNFYYYMEAGQNSPKEFDANQDRDTPVYHQLSPPIQSRYIRLRPTAWHSHISMRMELYGCKIACTEPLGMESGLITDAQITASSEWDANHAATQARLNFKAGGGKQGGWSTRPNDLNQWIQIDLVSYTKVTRIATQGRNAAHNQWVTKYKLQYSDDGVNFYYYMEAGQNSPKEFDANQDRDTPVYHQLSPPIQSRYIRLRPTAWHSHISMRMELYGCKIACTEPLGMESGLITDAQITASSEWDANHAATQARLNFKAGGGKQGGWSTRPNDLNQWIQIDLVSYTKVTRIATQGRNAAHNQWVTKYKLQYSDDGVNFYYYMEAGQNSPKEFDANQDRDTPVYHQLSPPIQSRYIRLRPTAWHSHISMRMELYGCKIACTEPLGMESGLITDAQITASSEWDANHAATQARLNFKAGGGKQGGWSTRPNDLNQWIQIDLVSYTKVTRIATQGRNAAHNQWVTKYKLQYSDDGVNFYYYMEAGQNSPKEFDANQDRDTPVYHQLSPPIQSRYIRLRPTAWHSHISMRMELYGCKIACTEPLGMESGLITDAQITASSEWDANHAATQARLNFKAGGGKQGGWSTRPNDLNQWIQIDLVSYTKVTRIATQGRNAAHNQWVTKYKLQYSDDGVNFYYYMEAGQNSPKEFDANQDRDTPVYHQLSPPIQSRYIRLRPTAWHSHISMRMELYGCKIACTEPLGMESGLITDAQITASSEWDANHAATQARLNFKAGGGKQGGWSTRPNDLNQWIQIDLVSYTEVTRIATQGRNAAHNQWVTKYKLQYSDDGVNFYYYMEAGQNSPKEFDANQDRDTPVYHQLSPPIQSRYIRLRPTAWHSHISMRMELYGCKIACTEPLGMESGLITDAQITASSEWDANHAATQARLNFKAGGGKQGGWSTRPNDLNQWIQIDLVSYTKVTRIATQGRNAAHNQWVTKYKLQYSDDGVNFYYYMEAGQNSPKEFDANQDRDTPVYHQLSPPIQSRYIRLRPTAWHSHISMRMELYGCKIACTEPLGMESGLITDAQITASSEWDANHAATQARLNFKAGGGKQGGWSTRPNDLNQWIQIDLVSYTKVTRIATQGRNAAHNQWVTKYKLQYSDDGVNFYYYMEAGQNSPKEFDANQDRDTPVYHQLSPPIQSRYIRLRPTAWHSHISMRMELYGCKIACTEPLGMESGLITDAQITASSEWDANHAATQARLNFKAGGGKQGGWSTRPNDLNQWIQIDLVSYTEVTRIATQGRNAAHNQWVTKYKLQYSDDGVNFYYYMEAGQNSPKEFDANQDRDTPVYHQLSPPIQSRYIRLRPTAWHSHISMRMELYGCKIACTEPLGMESGLITDAQITASSEWDANHAATQARLNFKAGGGKQGGWSTRPNDLNQWIQIDLVSYTKVTRIATQGRNAAHNQWVTKYKLQYSDDGVNFYYYMEAGQNSPKEFDANQDRDTPVYHQLSPPIQSRYIRLRPTAWHSHISMRMELYGCKIACTEPLGMESGLITDAQITASSEWDANHAATQARLNFKAGGGKQGGWSTRPNDLNQWIQIDLVSYTKVTRIATQGRNAAHNQWVTKYKLQYSDDGVNFYYYMEAGQNSPKEFDANQDRDTPVYHQLSPPIQSRYIRLRPTAWHSHISMRMELYGCKIACTEPLGMESGLITDAQITASSEWDANHAATQARLNFKAGGGKQGGWSTRPNDLNQWIQIDLVSYTKVTRIATQGRNAAHNQWVTKYKLQYSDDGVNFYYYMEAGQNSPKEFDANQDRDTPVYHQLSPPIQSRYIRLRPTAWHSHISMRMELYGCKIACTEPLGMESGLITDAQITASSEWDANHAATQARLNFKAGGGKQGGWSTRPNDLNQWIQIDLVSYTKVTRIATQGRNAAHNQWVTKYKLQYSDDGVNFYYYMEAGQNSPKEFDANQDRDTPVYHQLSPPIQSRYIRLRPTAWHSHISMRMELYGCKIACTEPLGMESGLITDAQITASSEWDANHAATQARLNFKAGGGKQGGWSTRPNDLNQWIQIDLVSYTKVTRIATQGRNAAHNQWVTKYKLQYSDDGVNFYYYMEAGQNSPKEFDANQDRDTPVYHQLSPPIQSRYIRLRPTAWHSHISMRMELYGCKIACTEPLGMESGLITDAQITASSEWDANHVATQARLNFKAGGGKQGGWSTRPNDLNQWIQIDLVSYTKVTRIATQGRNAAHNQWVTKYKLQYSDDGVNFYYYMEAGQNSPKEFDANQDRDTPVYHQLSPPIQSRYIRLRPTAWHSHISMRMELYGCKACASPLGMESRLIKDDQISASSQADDNHAAHQGRLNFLAGGGKQGGWSAKTNDLSQWIKVDLFTYTKVTGVSTQGRNAEDQRVTKYKLQYSDDGATFQFYKEPGQSSDKILDGNQDSDTIVYHQLNPPIQARYIRIFPTVWHNHISMRMELYGCPACSSPLGMESRLIKDDQISASSQADANHAAHQGRLNFLAGGGKQGGWSAKTNDLSQWIKVDLLTYTKVTGVSTQGRNAEDQRVTKYKLQYSDDGATFLFYKEPGQSSAKVFEGNQDSDTIVYHQLNPPMEARFIRLLPTAWHNHISMRMELYGCPACSSPLGMEGRLIKDNQISASSQADANHAAHQGRLNFLAGGGKQGGWSAKTNDLSQWIKVDLLTYTKVTGVSTQGRNAEDQRVTKYKLQYSDDGVTFDFYKEPGASSAKIFDGNHDSDTIVYHQLNPPIQARYIRLLPTAWHNHISMRMELYGCRACSSPLGMEGRLIKDNQISASSQADDNHAAHQGRLNFLAGGGKQGGWSAKTNDLSQWIQVNLLTYTKVTGVSTQGRNAEDQRVTKYKLKYSDDGATFHFYKEPGQSLAKIFDGNQDSDTIVYHQLNPPIEARYIRLLPTAWHNHISMRMELYGCSD
ncbi:uncharacterized protein LOC144659348 [Oculina patagonica]